MTDVHSLVEEFTRRLAALVESQTIERARQTVQSALGARRPGRPPKLQELGLGAKLRRKGPIQLCPVPGCSNRAAPIFGMVCAEHKDLPKAKIKKYREARRAAKPGRAAKPAQTRAKQGRRPSARKRATVAARSAKRSEAKKPMPRTRLVEKSASKPPVAETAAPPAAPAPAPPATA